MQVHVYKSPCTLCVVQVIFSPDKEGKYGEYFSMECDNGETISFSLTGQSIHVHSTVGKFCTCTYYMSTCMY